MMHSELSCQNEIYFITLERYCYVKFILINSMPCIRFMWEKKLKLNLKSFNVNFFHVKRAK